MKIKKHTRGNYYTTLTIAGKKNFIYGNTLNEVEVKYTEMKYKYHHGYNVNDNPILESYMIQWYNTYKKNQGAIKTQDMYRNCINTHINPALGSKKVKDITGTHVQKLLNGITSSKSLAHKVRITLNQIFKQAIADRIITFNPVCSTKTIAPDKPKRNYLTPAQRNIMLQALEEHRFYPLVFTILYTGMRMGEALALMRNDIDFENRIIKVRKATEFEHSKPKRSKTKTERGIRDIPTPEPLYSFLRRFIKNDSIFVFPGHEKGQMGLTELTRIWRSAKKKINKWFEDNEDMKEYKFNLTFRLLRHTYCTGLFDANVDELSAAEIMGHDVNIMRGVYTHISNERKKKTFIQLETLYKSCETRL